VTQRTLLQRTSSGTALDAVDSPKSDPGNGLSRRSSRAQSRAPELISGAVMDLVTLPARGMDESSARGAGSAGGGWEGSADLARQAAEVLVAASCGNDPRDDVLNRLLPCWLPVLEYTSEQRSAFGRGADGAEEGGYWAVVRVLYSHVVVTLGLATARKVVDGWKTLEAELKRCTGWDPVRPGSVDDSQLSLRHSLQVGSLACSR
jgi:hypothetical protein